MGSMQLMLMSAAESTAMQRALLSALPSVIACRPVCQLMIAPAMMTAAMQTADMMSNGIFKTVSSLLQI